MGKKTETKKTETKKTEAPSDIRRLWKRTKELPCPLTDTELLAAGDDLAKVVREIAVEEDRQKGMRESQKARITQLEGKKSELATMTPRREAERDVEIEAILDFKRGVAEEVRLDTGEVLHTRPLTEDERQTSLLDPDAEVPAGDATVPTKEPEEEA